jgi:O-antigen/teichoic acid export membrane protein
VRNIWILSENKQKYLWILNLSGALMNVALNAVLIPMCGIMGASYASLVTQIFTNVILNFIVAPIRENNVLMWKSLNPKVLFDMVNILLKKKKPQAIESAETEKKE